MLVELSECVGGGSGAGFIQSGEDKKVVGWRPMGERNNWSK